MADPRASVLIVTMNSRENVLECLGRLASQTHRDEILVADNGNDEDGTSSAIRAAFPNVMVETLPENIGVGRALNLLSVRATGEILVRLDDDMFVDPQFLDEICKPFSDPGIGMVAGLALQPGGELIDGFGMESDVTLVAYNRLRHRRPGAQAGVLLGPVGCAAAYRRTAWDQVGGIEPSFLVYTEDQDLALRIRLAGWQATAASGARGIHLGGATTGIDSDTQRRNAGFGRGFLLRRFGVMRTRHAPRALLVEALTVLAGIWRGRSLIALTSRFAGWRAAGGRPPLAYPKEGIDDSISTAETLRRLRFER